MRNDFLNELFGIVGFTEEEKVKLREDLKAILSAKISTAFFEKLSEEEKKSLAEYLAKTQPTVETVSAWLETHGYKNNEEMVKRLDETVKQSLKDFLSAIVSDLDETKKQAVITLANQYI